MSSSSVDIAEWLDLEPCKHLINTDDNNNSAIQKKRLDTINIILDSLASYYIPYYGVIKLSYNIKSLL